MKTIDGKTLALDEFFAVAHEGAQIKISSDAYERIAASEADVQWLVERNIPTYGVNTGFGDNSRIVIPFEDTKKLQEYIVRSHAATSGEPYADEVVRGAMLLRLSCFANGNSGVRKVLTDTLTDMLNKGVTPVVHDRGSVGSSGDLAPLAEMSLPILGLGQARYNGETLHGKEAMEQAGIQPLELSYKEGLALTNGFQFGTSLGALSLYRTKEIADTSDVVAAMFVEALKGIPLAFKEELQQARPHAGQITCAKNILDHLEGSTLPDWEGKTDVHSAYSIKCMPQILGSLRDALPHVEDIITTEMNAATDNPLLFKDSEGTPYGLSGGNFHGQVVGNALAYLTISLGASVCKNFNGLVTRITDKNLNEGLPGMLVESNGLNSGFMIPQYALASIVNEYKTLATPAVVDSIPTCAMKEDVVSMGTNQARQLYKGVDLAQNVLAISALTATQALYFRLQEGAELGKGTRPMYERISTHLAEQGLELPYQDSKAPMHDWMKETRNAITGGKI